jgi:predicted ATPase
MSATPSEGAVTVLRGRGDECRRLERLLDSARGGTSAMLVIRGEAGVGKTALLDYVAERASDCRVVRASGVESEMGYPFAALLQLLRAPILRNLEQLAPPQRDALRRAAPSG